VSYYDRDDDDNIVGTNTPNRDIGREIYMRVLDDRYGFRNDQIGIEDPAIWAEIFEAMGAVAVTAVGGKSHD
jgi:hypothetical protein